MTRFDVRDLGRLRWAEACELQRTLVDERRRGEIRDQLLFVEHPHVITMGRNSKDGNVLAPQSALEQAGIELFETNRGGDVTYHGPGQIVGYPIFDLNDWKRDVHLYVRAIEEAVIRTLGDFGIAGERSAINSGVWVGGAKICALGIHISRWITSHGFALNHTTDMSYFGYINPCGLSRPVTSMAALGVAAGRAEVIDSLTRHFDGVFSGEVFAFENQVLETV